MSNPVRPDDLPGDVRPAAPPPVRRDPLVSRSPDDLLVPGVLVEVTRDEAEAMGAFEETALSEDEAWEANADLGVGADHVDADGAGTLREDGPRG
jgi:type IV secretion system protein VirB1